MAKRKVALTVFAVFVAATVSTAADARADESQIKPGDTIVVLNDTHVQAGKEKLASVESGTELVATEVRGEWIAVTVEREGKTISGWIRVGDLITNPQTQLAELFAHHRSVARFNGLLYPNTEASGDAAYGKLTVEKLRRKAPRDYTAAKREPTLARSAEFAVQLMDRDGDAMVSEQEFRNQPAQVMFLRIDEDADNSLTRHEFLTAAKKPTLDDLNKQLRDLSEEDFGLLGVPTPGTGINLTGCIRDFEGWRSQPTFDQCLKIMEDFVKVRDLRRSRLAWQSADRESPQMKARRAQSLFRWGDKNEDGKLTLDEFKQALPEKKREIAQQG